MFDLKVQEDFADYVVVADGNVIYRVPSASAQSPEAKDCESMNLPINPSFRCMVTYLAFCTFASAGCSTFAFQREANTDGPEPASFTVQVRPVGRKPKTKQVVLQSDMRLQDAVKESGARFRNKDVYIVRTSPQTGQKHKMTATIDEDTREVTLDTDYALHPGDVVVVAEDLGNDRMSKVFGDFMGK